MAFRRNRPPDSRPRGLRSGLRAALLLALALLLHAPALHAARGGPDEAGYTWSDYFSGCPLELIGFQDYDLYLDESSWVGPYTLDFPIPFYGRPVTEVWISGGGFITFSDPAGVSTTPPLQTLPDPAPPNHLIAALWHPNIARGFAVEQTPEFFHVRWIFGGLFGLEPVDLMLFTDGQWRYTWAISSWNTDLGMVGYENLDGSMGTTFAREGTVIEPGAPLPGDSISLCVFPPPFLDCSDPLDLQCGETRGSSLPLTGDTFATLYSCDPAGQWGNEKVVRLDNPAPQAVVMSVDDPGLDVFYVGTSIPCSESECVAGGGNPLDLAVLFTGSHHFSVDRTMLGGGDAFQVTAACSPLPPLLCGSRTSGDTTGAPSFFDSHPCAERVALDGPEVAYLLSNPGDGPLTMILGNAAADLWVVIYDEFGECLASGPGGATAFDTPPGDYVVIVDGQDGAEGGYTLSSECVPVIDCDSMLQISCGETVSADTTVRGGPHVRNYPCVPGIYDGPETVFTFHNPRAQSVSLQLTGADEQDVMLLRDCHEGSCFDAADATLSTAELEAGTYAIVIDGRDGIGGPFELSVFCGRTVVPEELDVTLPPGGTVTEDKTAFLTPDVPVADVLFAIDLTSSMGLEWSELKWNAREIVDRLQLLVDDLYVGLVTFEDYVGQFTGGGNCNYREVYGSGFDEPYRLALPLTDDWAAFQEAVRVQKLGEGGVDDPESYARVLWETVHDPAIGWRPGSRRIVVMFGDAWPHDCDVDACVGGGLFGNPNYGKDPGRDETPDTPDDVLVMDALAEMADAANDIVLLYFDSSEDPDVVALWDCFARITGGSVFELNSDGTVPPDPDNPDEEIDLTDLILEAILNETSRCETLTLAPEPGYEDWVVSLTPPELLDVVLPARGDFELVLGPPPGTPTGSYTFTVYLLCDGVAVAEQTVTILVASCTLSADVPEEVDECEGTTVLLDGSGSTVTGCQGDVLYQWRRDGVVVRPWDPDPTYPAVVEEGEVPYTLEVMCANDPGCPGSSSAIVVLASLPDPIPPPVDDSLRVAAAGGDDLEIRWTDLVLPDLLIGGYEVVALDADLGGPPAASEMDAADVVGGAAPGVQGVIHAGGRSLPCPLGSGSAPCRLLFYKVRGTSPCSLRGGPTCNPFPAQPACP